MGGALLEHWMSGGEEFTIVDPMLETAPEGVRLVRDRSEIAEERFDTIIVAIKPQMIDDVLPDYAANLAEGGYVLSIAAGASAARLAKAMDGAPVVRVMPNLPAAVGKGTSGVLAGPDVSDAQADHAMEMMRRTGNRPQLCRGCGKARLRSRSGSRARAGDDGRHDRHGARQSGHPP